MTEAAVECCRPTEIVPSAEPITVDTLPASEPIKGLESKATGISPLSRLAATPSAANAFILHLHRCTRTRGGTDTVLLFTTYSARLISTILNVPGRTSLRHSAREMVGAGLSAPALNHRRAIGRISASASCTCAQHCEAHPGMHRHAW
ncbi:hypothetical protein FOVG_18303 [Fusarium oxysporum f. sp. pisi HDV247]|uniref:Uncharacterized protein n=1 Tax=Fusarium oxysporum f. sp. pisi HDV247 TaxID=1080344 RepID=W9NHU4_FUSOX|nr:hypothetical protein FOVG_18303 [Fusarium oxysporum f. sp. pisi HDV247]